MIPKIIHYCWFGPNAIPSDQQAYIDGWKKLMPDYEFKCWNENNIDIKSIPFTIEALSAGKYAYVADYTRIYALYNEGGIYMDTDILLKTRFDKFLKYGVFTSYEYAPNRKDMSIVKSMLTEEGERKEKGILKRIPGTGLFSALIGSEKGHPFMKDCLEYYNTHSFQEVWDNSLTVPNILAFHAEKYGLKYKNIEQHLQYNIAIFDVTVFASKLHANKNSLAIHYCAASWKNKSIKDRIKGKLYDIKFIRDLINYIFPKY